MKLQAIVGLLFGLLMSNLAMAEHRQALDCEIFVKHAKFREETGRGGIFHYVDLYLNVDVDSLKRVGEGHGGFHFNVYDDGIPCAC